MAGMTSRLRVFSTIVIPILVIVIGIVYFNILAKRNKENENSRRYAAKKVLAAFNTLPSSTPTPTPTPTPTLTPTPVYTGYCLNIPVLLYHHLAPAAIAKEKGFSSLNVDSGVFDQQMGYIASKGFTTIFAEDLVNALKNHTALPAKSIVITIDDAYDDQYSYAFPILKKYNLKATLMVPTGLLGVTSGTNSYFTWLQLKEMIGSGQIRAANHTWSHAALSNSGNTKDQFEISTAQKQLHDELGISNDLFAYPYGTNAISPRAHTLLQQNNIIAAFSTIAGTYQCDSFIYNLHRSRVGGVFFPSYPIY